MNMKVAMGATAFLCFMYGGGIKRSTPIYPMPVFAIHGLLPMWSSISSFYCHNRGVLDPVPVIGRRRRFLWMLIGSMKPLAAAVVILSRWLYG